MKATLMIEGSPAALIAILSALPAGTVVASEPTFAAQIVGDDDDTAGDAPAATGQLDGAGLPHDPRIHSADPTITTKGVWRYRRGVDKGLIAQVEAELRARVNQPAQQPVAVTAPAPMPMPVPTPAMAPQPAPVMQQPQPVYTPQPAPVPMPVQQPVYEGQPAPVVQPMPTPVMQAPQPMPVPVQQPAPVQQVAPQPAGLDFGSFMQHLTQQMSTQAITTDYLAGVTAEIATAFGQPVNSITDIAPDPNKISYAVQIFQRDQRW